MTIRVSLKTMGIFRDVIQDALEVSYRGGESEYQEAFNELSRFMGDIHRQLEKRGKATIHRKADEPDVEGPEE